MKIFLFSCFLLLFEQVYSQRINGKTVSDSVLVSQVLVVNINSQEKTYSNSQGQFIINADLGDELRFVKEGYERKVLKITNTDEVFINLIKLITEIEEVEVKKKLSGNLDEDSKLFNENKKKVALNNDLKVYFKTRSSGELMKPKPGEFVQPVGQGFTIGGPDNKWGVTDLVEWIRENLTDEYFISLGLAFPEINSFLYYSLQSFHTMTILKYGYCSEEDVGNLKLHFETSYKKFRKK
ncbi:hypothetical protein NG800_010015 [Epilithonimonas ginsengisoli]|uniref:Carboxypeptidase-like regulatory domain-containing protein n=1 Tax=Epilithonimonas ginsengisoli TaxID=1245592 RepID=A0ABU4JHT8_9FLAO|nr:MULTISPECIES: hypothetical protein [Chryseobacterium group]MBV6880702.1 hypothetical protein [Epilithonimonas sp. FP105]MDW8549247.1 hypothetical protein [Epilithonimonas ginsengisoli]OAH76330.1 hypothetical protein AXA65_01185 [Chryseobacterium sp. FP211-J200]